MEKLAAAEIEEANAQFEELIKGASEEDLNDIDRYGATHTKIASALEDELEKAAYTAGAMDAAAMEDAMAAGEEIPDEAPMPSVEEIIMLLDQAVQAGEIDEETAMAIAEQLMAEEAAAEDMAEAMPEDVAAEELVASVM
jgi:hypothetical protein